MADKDLQEILTLIRKIDIHLKEMQIEFIRDKYGVAYRRDYRSIIDVIYNFVILSFQMYIVYKGFLYLKSTQIPNEAVIGIVAIILFFTNSFSNLIRSLSLFFFIPKRYKNAFTTLHDLKRDLTNIDERISSGAQLDDRYIELSMKLEEIIRRMNKSLYEINGKEGNIVGTESTASNGLEDLPLGPNP